MAHENPRSTGIGTQPFVVTNLIAESFGMRFRNGSERNLRKTIRGQIEFPTQSLSRIGLRMITKDHRISGFVILFVEESTDSNQVTRMAWACVGDELESFRIFIDT